MPMCDCKDRQADLRDAGRMRNASEVNEVVTRDCTTSGIFPICRFSFS